MSKNMKSMNSNAWRFHKYAKYESQYQPPDMVFGIVWAFLYSIYIYNLVTVKGNVGLTVSLTIGLVLNVFWIYAFLFFKTPTIAWYVLTLMVVLSVDAIVRMSNSDLVLQAVYQIIYLAWISFAFYLNGIIVKNYNVDHNIKNIFAVDFSKSLKTN